MTSLFISLCPSLCPCLSVKCRWLTRWPRIRHRPLDRGGFGVWRGMLTDRRLNAFCLPRPDSCVVPPSQFAAIEALAALQTAANWRRDAKQKSEIRNQKLTQFPFAFYFFLTFGKFIAQHSFIRRNVKSETKLQFALVARWRLGAVQGFSYIENFWFTSNFQWKYL